MPNSTKREGGKTDKAYLCFANCHIRLAFCDTPLIFNKAKNEDNWGIEYNEQRPHESLGNLTPEEFALKRTENSSLALH